MEFNCLKARATSRRQFTFYHQVPRDSWYSLYWPGKDESQCWPWSHPVILNTGPLDLESSTLTTRPLLHEGWRSNSSFSFLYKTNFHWMQLQHSFQNVPKIPPVTPQSAIFGFTDPKVNYHLINHILLIFKFIYLNYVYKTRENGSLNLKV